LRITIEKKELKKISLNFRITASRLLNTDFNDGIDNLKRFLNFVKNNPIIYDFILKNNSTKFDIKNVIQQREYSERFSIPCEANDEIAFTYQLLEYGANNFEDYEFLADGYSFSKKYQDRVDAFNKDVVNPFVNHIIAYLEEVIIDMGMDEKSNMSINFNGGNSGQINLSQDSSTINAVFNSNNSDAESIKELTVSLLELLQTEKMPEDEKEEIKEVVETINQEVTSTKPKKSILKLCLSRLTGLKDLATSGTGFFEAVNGLTEKIHSFINTIQGQ
jgi:hypothetical protein